MLQLWLFVQKKQTTEWELEVPQSLDATMQAAAGAEDHEEMNMDDALGGKTSGNFDRKANPQIAGNLAPPSESKGANGESGMVRA